MKNKLLAVSLLFFILYWIVGWYIPNVLLSSLMAMFSIGIGIALLIKYLYTFWQVMFKGVRSEKEDGAHLAAIGIPLVAASIVYGGVYVLVWTMAGRPEGWTGTPAANFARALLIGGCVALYFTPDVQRDKLSLPAILWFIAILITAAFVAFFMGAYIGSDVFFRIM